MARMESSHCASEISPSDSSGWSRRLSQAGTGWQNSFTKSSSEANSTAFQVAVSSSPAVPPYSLGRIFLGRFVWREFRSDPWRKNLFAIFSFRNGFMMAKMPLNIRGSFTMWTAFIRMGKPSCWSKKRHVRTWAVYENHPLCDYPSPLNHKKHSQSAVTLTAASETALVATKKKTGYKEV